MKYCWTKIKSRKAQGWEVVPRSAARSTTDSPLQMLNNEYLLTAPTTLKFALQNNCMSEEKSLNFLEEIIETDLAEGKYDAIVTRFPPEPS